MAAATCIDEVHTVCAKIRQYYGYEFFTFFIHLQRIKQPLIFYLLDYLTPWQLHYQKNNYRPCDPSIIATLSSITPKFWDASNPKPNEFHPRFKKIIDEGYDFGIRKLSCIPIRETSGNYGVFRFIHTQDTGGSDKENAAILSAMPSLYFLSSYIFEALIRILSQQSPYSESVIVTDREKEILQWAASGLSSSGIGGKLTISENTVLKHLKNIHSKFGVNTRQQAVAKALAANIITL